MSISYYKKYFAKLMVTAIIFIIEVNNVSNAVQNESNKPLVYLDNNTNNDYIVGVLQRYKRQAVDDGGCRIPMYPRHTRYKVLGQFKTNYGPLDYLPSYSALQTSCDVGYKLSPVIQNVSFCISGSWIPSLSNCLDACLSLQSIMSTNVKCSHGVVPLDNCYDPVDGTTALLTCNALYEDLSIQNNPSHLCVAGKWEPAIPQCSPICGQKRPKRIVNIINGTDIVQGDYPWHIGIYNSVNFKYLCGGAIISSNIIISAAHCVTNTEGVAFPSKNYMVGAGKYYREFNDRRDLLAQQAELKEIIIPDRYKGLVTWQALDIAVLILKQPFMLTIAVQPVCIELNENSLQVQLSLNDTGIVTGWGFTQAGILAEVLKEVVIPYIPYGQCYNELPKTFRSYLTADKLCGVYLNSGCGVCNGDSGGAYVFNNVTTDRYFIKGVVSTSPPIYETQDGSNQYSLYTSIENHIEFLRNITIRNRLRYYVECRRDKCAGEEIPEVTKVIIPINNFPDSRKCCTPSSTSNYCDNVIFESSCEIPINPPNTYYKILGASDKTCNPGDFATQFSTLDISCNKGYAVSPSATKRLLCENGKWSETPQACLSTCPSLISTKTTTVKCRYNNLPLENCRNPVTGTIVVLSCNPLHEEPNIRRNPIRVCREGRWNPSTSLCYPICGIKHPQGVVNVVGGTNVTIGDYPWQVGIYNSSSKELVCGGSILDQNIILTAAHCITDYNGNVQPVSDYLVAAGKYYRKYDEARDQFAQYSNILTMHVPGRYTGSINQFALDIAIVIISDPFIISEAVQPVCIELSEESQSIYLSQNDEGVVTGWGYTQEGGELSNVLKELIIPYIPYNICFNEVSISFRRYFTEDKICGGYKNNATSVCGGDSGGALVFKNIQSDRYYIQGIVSTSPATQELVCDSNQYSLYTYVYHHKHFVRDIMALNQHRKPLECITEGCT